MAFYSIKLTNVKIKSKENWSEIWFKFQVFKCLGCDLASSLNECILIWILRTLCFLTHNLHSWILSEQ